jgi:hypothetical protein
VPALTAVLDACVLYPAPLRDLLMNLALVDLFHARWTDAIHDEWTRNVLGSRPDLKAAQLNRTRENMNAAITDCLVIDYEHMIATIVLPDESDRHVVAAAVRSSSDVIVTYNLRDFPPDVLGRYNIKPQHPDQFIEHLLDLDEPRVIAAVKTLRAGLTRPPVTAEDYLTTLERQSLPQTAARLRRFVDLI